MDTHLSPTQRADTVFRGLFSLIFMVAGTEHLLNTQHIIKRLLAARLGYLATAIAPASFLVIAAGITLLLFGTMLLVGYRTRFAAFALAALLVPITVTVQAGSLSTVGPLLKNVALFGGLVHFALAGGGPISLDALLRGRRRDPAEPILTHRSLGLGGLTAGGLAVVVGVAVAAASSHPTRAGAAESGRTAPKLQSTAATGVAFLVRDVPTLKASLMTAQQMLAGKGFATAHAEVVACGGVVGQLVTGSVLEPVLHHAAASGVEVAVCGLSLHHAGIDPARLTSGVSTVPNGLVEIVRRQAAGWRTVTL